MLSTARRRGFASLMLWVLERNLRARRFYEGFGLRPDGGRQTRPEWLGEGVYEVRYNLELESSAVFHGCGSVEASSSSEAADD